MSKDIHIKQTFCEKAETNIYDRSTDKTALNMGLDVDYYQAFLDDVDISDDQKIELVETLWQIVVNFVELGFQIHPLNSVQGSAAKDETAIALENVIGDFASDALEILNDYEHSEIMDAIETDEGTEPQ